jgi:hypothetical protein
LRVHRTLLLVAALLAGCRPAAAPEREYGFVHEEVTGLTAHVRVAGSTRPSDGQPGFRDLAIEFSRDSDRDALETLYRLEAAVLYPNSDGETIIVVGTLDPTVRHTPDGLGRALSEPYQEFRLTRWYLRAPFLRQRLDGPDGPIENPEIEVVETLLPEDFGGRVGGDLSRFVRPRWAR